MAALKANNIDNLIIELDGIEPPVGNGSSDVFVEMIETAGIVEQKATTPIIKVLQPIYWSEGEIHLVALPHEGYKISYTLNYPEVAALRSQFQSIQITNKTFKSEIAPCRTFSLYKEIAYLMDCGLIKGASLSNGVAIDGDIVYSKDGLFFPDEPVRHKILDMIGDLGLIGFDFEAHVIAIRSGHPSNYAMAKKIYDSLSRESF
jgi:UDP-3-O-[3-hydroxymyristoyl] N-acetylglucosamine deacetylase